MANSLNIDDDYIIGWGYSDNFYHFIQQNTTELKLDRF